MKKFKRTLIAVSLVCFSALSGCASDDSAGTEASTLEVPDSLKSVSDDDLSDVPYLDSLVGELQSVVSEIGIPPVELLSYFDLNDSNSQCVFSFDYEEISYYAKFWCSGAEWHALYVLDARTAEPYWAADSQEDDMLFKRENMKK